MSQNEFQIGIIKIKDIEFFIDEQVEIRDLSNIIISFEQKTNFNTDDKTLELIFTVIYTNSIENKLILKIRTSNLFLVPDLLTFKKKDEMVFSMPDGILITLLSLSISHTRALLAKNSSGTKLANLTLPIVNPTEIYNKLFPKKKT